MDLVNFIIRAKLNTYAGQGEGGEVRLPDGALELSFQEGNLRYRDRYFGYNPFIGEEVVWQDGRAVWSMNYYGWSDAAADAKAVYGFLGQALRLVQPERPFRGPERYANGDFVYQDRSTGDHARFSGEECILQDGVEVYRLVYHGGRVG